MTDVSGGGFAVDLLLSADADASGRRGEPVRVGVPVARGQLRDAARLRISSERGDSTELQSRVLDTWGDGSIRWVLIDFLADRPDGVATVRYRLHEAPPGGPGADSPLTVVESSGTTTVDTGAARFRFSAGGRFPFELISSGDGSGASAALEIDDAEGRGCGVAVSRFEVEEQGPVRVVVRLEGRVLAVDGSPLAQLIARLHFCASSATVQFDLTLRNPRRARHPGGIWELGDEGSLFFSDVSVVVAVAAAASRAHVTMSPEHGAPFDEPSGEVEIFQASSGGEHWNSSTHVNRSGRVPLAFRGYRARVNGEERHGLRATPIAGAGNVAISVPAFWQNCPKRLSVHGNRIALGLFPREHGDLHELQGGEQKTHRFFVAFDRDGVCDEPLAWTRAPLFVQATPEYYAAAGALPYLRPATANRHEDYEQLVAAAIDGDTSFFAKREQIDEYGWRHFGELYADHEAVFHTGPSPLISHYNNQYDAVAAFFSQFLRSGDQRWWQLAADLAAHVVDIDLYHCDEDKAAYNRGLFWHTVHYVDAGRSTHRSYPGAPGVGGGGPSSEHNYSSGLLLHHFLTGEAAAREAAIDLAQWVVDMDDGGKTVFRVLSRGATGLASATLDQQGPGRGAGNSVLVLLNAYRLTRERRFLLKAEALIRRVVHPDDDVESRDLLNAERRWSYTVFLQALGEYLDRKAEWGELDESYSYARATLLAYARWMAARERPYLDEPEKLEYPTEAWAAQELWKSNVFDFAAKYAPAADALPFREKAEFFFRCAIETLTPMPTRTVARALVLLAARGWMRAACAATPPGPAPAPVRTAPFAPPARFVPQKEAAKQRLIWLALITAALAASSTALLW